MHITTVGELKKFLEDIPEDTALSIYTEGMEQRGYLLGGVNFTLKSTNIVSKDTYDAFDYEHYSYKAYDIKYDKDNGDIKVLIID